MAQLTLREATVPPRQHDDLSPPLCSYYVAGLPTGHMGIIRQLSAGGWRLLVARPGKTLEIRGEFLTVEAALARAQLEYDTFVW